MKNKFTKLQIWIYWFFIVITPFSLFTIKIDSLPIFVWLSGALGLISSVNRLRFQRQVLLKIIAGVAVIVYSLALGLLCYNYILDRLG
jgi:hypothetical protein